MSSSISRPRVFLDISIGTSPVGRLVIELFTDQAPKTCENFRSICTSSKKLSYKLSPFHRIIPEFMIQGGDITKGDGTGGQSIYGSTFEDENIGWREIDTAGLVCMANRGRNTNSSQFFITLAACEHLNAKHTVFGRVVHGIETLDRIAETDVDKDDRPLVDVLVSNCGELEKAQAKGKGKKRGQIDQVIDDSIGEPLSRQSTTSRGRHKQRGDAESQSRSRSRSPSRGHTRPSASRHRHSHRHRRQHRGGTTDKERDQEADSTHSRSPDERHHRRRSDAKADHTQRGRVRQRRRRSGSPILTDGSDAAAVRKRSIEPSRPGSPSPGYRRQRSLPNQYKSQQQRQMANDAVEEDRVARMEWERDGGERRFDDRTSKREYHSRGGGRLGGFDDFADGGQDDGRDGIVYKGRGAMKFKEKRKW